MREDQPARHHHMSALDRQMLTAAYLPVIAFVAVLIAGRISRSRRRRSRTAV